VAIGRQIVHRLAVGQTNITGDDFGGMFARAISGNHRGKPLGIADVEWNGCAWSVKTVQSKKPFDEVRFRCITGRNSPVYSAGIREPFKDIQATGRAVLEVWNGRVDEAMKAHDDLRIIVLARDMSNLQFTLFEKEAVRYVPSEYKWDINERKNLVATDSSGRHCFTWQPHGSQFTVIHQTPRGAYKFRIKKRPPIIDESHVLRFAKYADEWIEAFKVEVELSNDPDQGAFGI